MYMENIIMSFICCSLSFSLCICIAFQFFLFCLVVIKLEGGTDFDLKVLDKPYEDEKPKESAPYLSPE